MTQQLTIAGPVPRVSPSRGSLAAAYERYQRSPRHRWNRFVEACRQLWQAIEPGFALDHNNSIERWDARGEGRASCVSFEGFGITSIIFIGRTPKAVR